MGYFSLCEHFRSKCENVIIDCNSCLRKYTRKEFREHSCFTKLKEIEFEVLTQSKSELLQIFLEIQKLNQNGIPLDKCFTDYNRFTVIPGNVKQEGKGLVDKAKNIDSSYNSVQ